MADQFNYDVFLSHSRRDRERVREIAERLRADGLRVWPGVFEPEVFEGDGESLRADDRQAQREAGLEQSRVQVLCLSAHAYGDEWAQLEAETFRFRDPLNQARRFLLLRLDAAPIKESLAQFLTSTDYRRRASRSMRSCLKLS